MIVPGFKAAAAMAGVRYAGRLDVGLIFSETPATVAGAFTTNLVKAAPVLLDMERTRAGQARAILVNSGNANACTGKPGMDLARKSAALAAKALNIPEEQVLVASTGVIGAPLSLEPFQAIMPGLCAALSPEGFPAVARAIMTTDTVPKLVTRETLVHGVPVHWLGVAKGSGMINPHLATMLCFVVTDAAITSPALDRLVQEAVATSFNVITVDGDTSTNDTVLVMANGQAKNPLVTPEDRESLSQCREALGEVMAELARMIVQDGEGATKFVTIRVTGARDQLEAEAAARTIANSNLVKTAFFGEDANWGRIIAALGRSGAWFDPERVDIAFDEVLMVKDGLGQGPETEAAATAVLKKKVFSLQVDLKAGTGTFAIQTCDFSLDYVKINADYRS